MVKWLFWVVLSQALPGDSTGFYKKQLGVVVA
jgi:hypothetical protein